jgi:hypothetical protein
MCVTYAAAPNFFLVTRLDLILVMCGHFVTLGLGALYFLGLGDCFLVAILISHLPALSTGIVLQECLATWLYLSRY